MNCPARGSENTDETTQRPSSKHPFDSADESSEVKVRLSRLALVSAICALIACLGILSWMIYGRYALDGYVLGMPMWPGTVAFCMAGLAFLLGLMALADILHGGGQWTGYGFVAFGMAGPVGLILVIFVMALLLH